MTVSISRDDILFARKSVDLGAFLLRCHPTAVERKCGSILLISNSHISTKEGYHGYTDFRTGETGNNIDYLVNFLDYSFQDAVIALNEFGNNTRPNLPAPPISMPAAGAHDNYKIPQPANTNKHIIAYLLNRAISRNTIMLLINRNLIYQSEQFNNLVFINPEHDYYEVRGTNTFAEIRCKNMTSCPDYCEGEYKHCKNSVSCPKYRHTSFHGCGCAKDNRFWYFKPGSTACEVVYICEASIDAISLYEIHCKQKKAEAAVYVSIGGVSKTKTIDRVIRLWKNVVLAVDNDEAGQNCRDRYPSLPNIIPKNKDWNEDLKRGDY